VITVVLENTDYEQALAQPFLAQLARNGGLLTNYSAVTHPSQPNYFALTAGSTFGASNDRVTVDARHIGDLVETKGGTWKAYAEQYGGQCDTGAQSGNYVRRHEPFISFKNVQSNPSRCQRIVNAAQLQTDVTQGTLPSYALYVPDLRNDGHDTGVVRADRWLASKFGPLLQDSRFRQNTLLMVTFDEDSGGITSTRSYRAIPWRRDPHRTPRTTTSASCGRRKRSWGWAPSARLMPPRRSSRGSGAE